MIEFLKSFGTGFLFIAFIVIIVMAVVGFFMLLEHFSAIGYFLGLIFFVFGIFLCWSVGQQIRDDADLM
jgi:hypothetical protein